MRYVIHSVPCQASKKGLLRLGFYPYPGGGRDGSDCPMKSWSLRFFLVLGGMGLIMGYNGFISLSHSYWAYIYIYIIIILYYCLILHIYIYYTIFYLYYYYI